MECRIRFHDKNFEQFDWCKLEDDSESFNGSGTLHSDELKNICADSEKVTIFLPQIDVLLTSEKLPPKANNQQLNAIAFAVEDHLAEDIDDCFFATTTQQIDHSVPVAVINREIMDSCVQLLSHHHLNVRSIIPEGYLCPWSGDDDLLASICPIAEGYLIRYGQHESMYCEQSLAPQMIELLYQQKSSVQKKLEIYADEDLIDIELEGMSVVKKSSVQLLSQTMDPSNCINLKQKEYQSAHQWIELLKHWRIPVVAMVILSLVFFSTNLIDLWKRDKQYDELIQQQNALLQQYLPEYEFSEQPKKQLIQVLADNNPGQEQVGFIDLMHEFSKLKTGFDAVIAQKIVYQQSSLAVNLETKDLNSMESFRAKLEESRFSVQIENVNINPDKTTGRLVMSEQ